MRLLQMSVSGAAFIAAVIMIRAAAVNKLPKKTFLVFWELVMLRLLVPFYVPSMFSVYTWMGRVNPMTVLPVSETNYGASAIQQGMITEIPAALQPTENIVSPASVWSIIWAAEMMVLALFFAVSYLRCLMEFRAALPVQNGDVEQWLKAHPLKRPVSVKQSDRISAPLTYGIFRPVILMPKRMDWENTKQLEYMLSHEYVHICHYDAAVKLIAALTLCIHWFNPLVWVMYFLFNRDIELVCDESVIRQFGEESRSAYSLMLINMEAAKSGLLPFCSSFSKNAAEERITAIMKTKKTSLLAICIAGILVIGVTAAFATSAEGSERETDIIQNTGFSAEDAEKLLALQFEGYEAMTVSEFQNKVWTLTDTEEYRKLLDDFSKNSDLYEERDRNKISSFLFFTLEPLTAERWQTREFNGGSSVNPSGTGDNAELEFVFSLTIQDADTLTVGEYDAARQDIITGLQNTLLDKTDGQLRDEAFMQKEIRAAIEILNEQWNSDSLQISIEYIYQPLSELDTGNGAPQNARQEQEKREYPNGTEEDYRSLFALKTASYQKRPVADFNMDLLEWANENYERMERINGDIGYNDFTVNLNREELSFVTLTTWLSGAENGKYVQSNYTGRNEEDPVFNQYLPSKTAEKNGYGAWCDLFYQFSYHIADKKALTVGARDECVSNMINGIRDFWNGTDIEQMLTMTEGDVARRLKEIAARYSNNQIAITIHEDSVHFEKMDERNIEFG